MTGRRVLAGVVALVAVVSTVCAQNLPVPELPYDYGDLAPVISEEMLRVHHLGHHAGYTRKLNSALATLRADVSTKALAKLGVDELIQPGNLARVPEKLRTAVRNNGGGYVNHDLFWHSMAPVGKGGAASAAFEEALANTFGSVDTFQAAFTSAAKGLFGSGYAWLVASATGELAVTTTANQDVPTMPNGDRAYPILVLDVWEHAYYLGYKNNRGAFVDDWWSVVDWQTASQRFERATESGHSNEL